MPTSADLRPPATERSKSRLADIEGSFAETLYRQHRKITGIEITLGRMATAAGIPVATPTEVDAALDDED
jgi:hypothetical protein